MNQEYLLRTISEDPDPSRSPGRLVPHLNAELLGHLREAHTCIQGRDLEGKSVHLQRALTVALELSATLGPYRTQELAARLLALYTYFASEILGIGRTLDLEHLGRIVALLESLHQTWMQAGQGVHSPLAEG